MNNSTIDILDLLTTAEEKGMSLFLRGDKLSFTLAENKTVEPEFINYLKSNKEDLIKFLKSDVGSFSTAETFDGVIEPVDRNAVQKMPLSFAQERLWFIDKLQGSTNYHLPSVQRINGALDLEVLEAAFVSIVNRHEILRTIYLEDNGQGYQELLPESLWQLEIVDASGTSQEELDEVVKQTVEKPFDLSADHMIRAKLFQLAADESLLVIVIHHIASDGWSTPIFTNELREFYQAKKENRQANVRELGIQYADYAMWQRTYLNEKVLDKKLQYWEDKLNGAEALNLPLDFSRPAIQSTKGNKIAFSLDKNIAQRLSAVAQEEGATLFMLLTAAYRILLYRYTGQQDICIGTPTANRTQSEVESLIGFFVNTLALRSPLEGSDEFVDYLKKVKTDTLEAYNYQEIPFEKVVDRLGVERDMSQSPVFQTMFVLQNNPEIQTVSLETNRDKETTLSAESAGHVTSQFDLTFVMTETSKGIKGSIEYCTDILLEESVERMAEHYQNILTQIAENPDVRIDDISILSRAEETLLLKTFNATDLSLPLDKTLVNLFENQALKSPENIALVFEDKKLTYQELDHRSTQLATYLSSHFDLKTEDAVGLMMDRSELPIIAMLAVLKTGAAYVPIDVDYPISRKTYITEDAQLKVLLTESKYAEDLADFDVEIIALDQELQTPDIANFSSKQNTEPSDLAYILYTSGSTGMPKGCLVENRNIVNYITGQAQRFEISEADRILQTSNIAFDASLPQIFLALTTGASLFMIEKERLLDGADLAEFLKHEQITHLDMVPSLLANLPDQDYPDLKRIIVGGEICPLELAKKWSAQCTLYNEYGPTEATVGCTVFQYDGETLSNSLPIGSPLSNVQIYVLDDKDRLAPLGVAGEICIGGAGVARGYLNQPELTDKVFVKNPLNASERIYRSGDLGRWLSNGEIEIIGRKDNQIKIRGYRIELGEIEATLNDCDQVKQGAILVQKDAKNNKRLIAYVVPEGEYNREEIMVFLRANLPEYMVPYHMMELAEMPISTTGKVDKKLLPELDLSVMSTTYEAPQSKIEIEISEVWKDLLDVEQVGVHDNFFELGGDSIITIQVVSRCKRKGHHFQVHDLFKYQTIAELAEFISTKEANVITASQETMTGAVALMPIQQDFLESSYDQKSHYNQAVLLKIEKSIDAKHLEQAIEAIVKHHDALRFTYQKVENETDTVWKQFYGEAEGKLIIQDLSGIELEDLRKSIGGVCDHYQGSLNIEIGDLIKTVLIQTPNQEAYNRLFIVVHHLAVDGVSWRILMDDIDACLQALAQGEAIDLGFKTNSYRDWVNALTNLSTSRAIEAEHRYWEEVANSYESLPTDFSIEGLSIKDLENVSARLDEEKTTQLLKETNQIYNTQINDILLSALTKTISEWTTSPNVILGMEGHGRESLFEDIDISNTVGWFTNLYPVRIATSEDEGIGDLIKSVKEQLRTIPNKGIGYNCLRYLHPSTAIRESLSNAQWDIEFNYHGQIDNVIKNNDRFEGASESKGRSMGENYVSDHKLGITGTVSGGILNLSWTYSSAQYKKETILELANRYMENLQEIIEHCAAQATKIVTPSDFGLEGKIEIDEIDDLFGQNDSEAVLDSKDIAALFELSPLQEGMLFHGLYDHSATAYVSQVVMDLPQGLNVEAFRSAWNYLIKKYTILRTGFIYDKVSLPLQCVFNEAEVPFEIIDISDYSEEDKEAQFDIIFEADKRKGFDFIQPPLMRVVLVKMDAVAYRMIWANHHILWDGWSSQTVTAELLQAYEMLVSGKALPAIKEDKYEDYIKYINSQDPFAEETFWSEYMSGFDTPSLIPFVAATKNRNKGMGVPKTSLLEFNAADTEKIKSFAQATHVTVNTLIQGIWSLLLAKYSGKEDVVFGVTVSGRPADLGFEGKVGLYINTLPLRSVINPEASVAEWLTDLQNGHSAARTYQYTALSKVQNWIDFKGDLFDSILILKNFPISKAVSDNDWDLQVGNVKVSETNNYLLSIDASIRNNIRIEFNYNSTLLDDFYAEKIKSHFQNAITEIVFEGKEKVGNVSIVSLEERQVLLEQFNDTKVSYAKDETVLDLFYQQVETRPNATAMAFDGKSISYKELNVLSNQLAHYLLDKGVQQGDLVPICIDRSFHMIVSIFGLWKIGAAYVPLDPSYPQSRINFMLEDINSAFVLSTSDLSEVFSNQENLQPIYLNQIQKELEQYAIVNPSVQVSPKQLAYVIYTSGSTGKPKGVMIEHGALFNFINGMADALNVDETLNLLSVTTFTFDISLLEFFLPLSLGGVLHLADNTTALDPEKLMRAIARLKPSLIQATPSRYQMLVDAGWKNEEAVTILSGGEALPENLKNALTIGEKDFVWNVYGPTETTIWSSIKKVYHNDTITIGQPIANTQMYILSDNLEPLPIGVQGDLYIAGDGLARGYWNRPELTKDRFVNNPFEPGKLMYKTGDLAKFLANGEIEFYGRKDYQVKIRGYRIELGEIETHLEKSDQVNKAVVIVRKDNNGHQQLIAYVVAEPSFDATQVTEELMRDLPEYMVPRFYVELSEIPLTSNGKVNRKALPEPDAVTGNATAYTAPRTETETELALIWQKLLNVKQVGVHDNFFQIGGHSLIAIRVVSAIRKVLKKEVVITDLFEHVTLEALARYLDGQSSQATLPALEKQTRPERIPLSYSQERLWFIDKLQGSTNYHMPTVQKIEGVLDVDLLEAAFRGVVNRHEILRTVYGEERGHGYQVVLPENNWTLEITDQIGASRATIDPIIKNFVNQAFDLSADHMLRAKLIQTGVRNYILVMVQHHIASDGWSAPILINELLEFYRAGVENRTVGLQELAIQYADHAIWQRMLLGDKVLEKGLQYWEEKLSGVEVLKLPLDYQRPAVQSMKGAIVDLNLGEELVTQLSALAQREGVTLFMILTAAYQVLLHRYTGQDDICIGSPIANRTHSEVEPLIGFFVNTLAIRSEVNGTESFDTFLKAVKNTTLEAYQHQAVPFEKVVDRVVQDRDRSQTPIFQTMLALQTNMKQVVENGTFDMDQNTIISPEESEQVSSKFDLTFDLVESRQKVRGTIEYCTDLFEEETIVRLANHFKTILEEVAAKPEILISEIPMLSKAEEQLLTIDFNASQFDYPSELTVLDLFEQQVSANPNAVAVVEGEQWLTYKELDEQSNRLANYLQQEQVQPGELIPVCMERSLNLIVAYLGVIKSGGAYAPIDPAYPKDRIAYILRDTSARFGLTQSSLSDLFDAGDAMTVIKFDQYDWSIYPSTKLEVEVKPSQLVYTIYTSGTTGIPKGALITHDNLNNLVHWHNRVYEVSSTSRATVLAGIGFDASTWEIWPYLSAGSTIFTIEGETRFSVEKLRDFCIAKEISHSFVPTVLVPDFVECTKNKEVPLDYVVTGGDALPIVDIREVSYRLFNNYGPTENTVITTFYELEEKDFNQKPSIGKPVDNVQIYILDQYGNLVPRGAVGEIYAGGKGVARGYLNRPELTEERFVKDPFSSDKNARLYKTGDLAKWMPDGNIDILGRIDNQIQIRGYRVELGEIESVMNKSGLISQCIVRAKKQETGSLILVAYVIAEKAYDKETMLNYVKAKLPIYMIPSVIIELEAIPLTANGKVDRRALPEPDGSLLISDQFVAPRNATEAQLATIWKSILKLDKVGVQDNFFELGGHSLLATRVVSAIREQLNVELQINALFTNPTIAELAVQLATQEQQTDFPRIEKQERPAQVPLSYAQERLWFIDQLQGSTHYHIPIVRTIRNELDASILESAFNEMVNRHEILRTVYLEEQGQAYQKVLPKDQWSLELVETSTSEKSTDELIQYHTERPFDLSRDHMMRACLIKQGEEDYVLVLVLHHIASDGWSNNIFINEFSEIYQAKLENRSVELPSLDLQYADYAIWQRRYLSEEVLENKLNYWEDKLVGVEVLDLPIDFVRPAIRSTRGSAVDVVLSPKVSQQLNELAQRKGATLYMVLLAAYKVLLTRYTGQEDICVGSPIANRTQAEVESLIGFFINTLPLRSQVDGHASFSTFLQQVKETTLEAYDYQDVPLEKMVDRVLKERDMSQTPLFQTLFSLQNMAETPTLNLDADESVDQTTAANSAEAKQVTSKFDLTFVFNETSTGLQGSIEYSTDLFEETTIVQLANHFKTVLEQIAVEPEVLIKEIEILSEAEKQELIVEFNTSQVDYPSELTVLDLFDQQVSANPNAIAMVEGENCITYKELDDQSNRLANYLRQEEIQPEEFIPVCMNRSLDLLVAYLGVLKAGGAYAPIDPTYPKERIAYILQDTSARYGLIQASLGDLFDAYDAMTIINIDQYDWSKYSTIKPEVEVKPEQLIYTIYTSGTTGMPKGVLATHAGVNNVLHWHNRVYEVSSNSSTTMLAGIGFDASTWEIWPYLSKGATIFTVDAETRLSAEKLRDFCVEHKLTHAFVPTVLALDFVAYTKNTATSLEYVMTGGDALPMIDVSGLSYHLFNNYGPTENTVITTYYKIEEKNATLKPPIGKPVDNVQVYILDKYGNIVPRGVVGEIYAGGNGVAKGYLNRPELTAERFVENPFSSAENARLYKTGDLAKWLPDGNIDILGRIDNQIQIRGYRVELGEIESVMNQSGLISQCIVQAKKQESGGLILVAYVIAEKAYNKEKVLDYVKAKLPIYMVPAVIIELEAIPLTSNGKLDQRALPEPSTSLLNSDQFVAPRNTTEEQLVGIWKSILKLEKIGVHDNFFELGGHSLLATRVVSAIREQLEVELRIDALFSNPTIAELAMQLVTRGQAASLPKIEKQERPAQIPLSYAQERLWFIDQLQGSTHYHIPMIRPIEGALETEVLESAFNELVNRHEVLRTVYLEEKGQVYQEVLAKDNWSLEGVDASTSEKSINELVKNYIERPFDLSKDYMMRACVIKQDEGLHIMVLVTHHIASDGWSNTIFVKEFSEIYQAKLENRPLDLPDLDLQYADYAIWQRRYLNEEVLENKLNYWEEKLSAVEVLDLPLDFVRPSIRSTKGSVLDVNLSPQLSQRLNELAQREGVTLYMLLLAAYKVLLSNYTNQEDICVGSPIANRTQAEVESLIGFFINTLPLRSQINPNAGFSTFLQNVKQTTLEAYNYQDVPLEKMVDRVLKDRDVSQTPLFQTMFSLQNMAETPALDFDANGDAVQVESSSLDKSSQVTSKFDLTFVFSETSQGLQGNIEYCTDLFEEATIVRLSNHFEAVLEQIAAKPDVLIKEINVLSKEEERLLVVDFNASQVDYPADLTMLDLFAKQVSTNPKAIAIVEGDESFTYKELDEQSNRVANYLLEQEIKTEELIPVCMDRSIHLITTYLGIMKSGGVYVPIDPAYPKDRIAYTLKNTAARFSFIQSSYNDLFETENSTEIIEFDQYDWSMYPTAKVDVVVQPEQLVYSIYTSGTTGKPKGVLITHENLSNFVHWVNRVYEVSSKSRTTLLAGIGFDASVLELWPFLASGATAFTVEGETRLSVEMLRDFYTENKISHSYLPTVLVPDFVECTKNIALPLECLITGGDALPPVDVSQLSYRLIDNYGPTENTVVTTFYEVQEKDLNRKPSIGKPVDNVQVYLLDQHGKLVPPGVVGELYTGGKGVARGYLNRPELTAERFIKDPFSSDENARLYKTGDLAKWLPDGNLDILGRIDSQVQIRGFRVELGEIESVMKKSGLVNQCTVLPKKQKDGSLMLVAYVIEEADYDKQIVLNYAKSKLPVYMVPTLVIELDEIPLTANGKVDKRALPEPDEFLLANKQFVAPRNIVEEQLAAIWKTILKLEKVSVHDNFFELGGHSLLATRVVSAIREQLKLELRIDVLFSNPTIAELAMQLKNGGQAASLPKIEKQERPAQIPLSYAQERLWFIDQLQGSTHYHIPMLRKISGTPDVQTLESALQEMINRHEILRTVYLEESGQAYQKVLTKDNWFLEYVETLTSEQAIDQLIHAYTERPFDLSTDHMIRACLFKQDKENHVLVLVLHHIASDGWSNAIFVNEFSEIYQAKLESRPVELPSLDLQYADYAIWQRRYLNEEVLESKLNYWEDKLRAVEVLDLPVDFVRPAIRSTRGSTIDIALGSKVSQQLNDLAQREGVTLYMVLLAAYNVLLARYTGQEDICVGSPIANRTQAEVESLIGFFINTLPLRSQVDGHASFSTFLQNVKQTTLEAYDYQDVPLEKMVDRVLKERDMSQTPLFQTIFSLQNMAETPTLDFDANENENQTTATNSAEAKPVTSKFDLTIAFSETSTGLQGNIEYSTDLFEEATIVQLSNHFKMILEQIVVEPEVLIKEIELLSKAEEKLLLSDFNASQVDNPSELTVLDLFDQQVLANPNEVAIVEEGKSITYQELDEYSNRLANHFSQQQIQEEELIPVCMDRSLNLIIAYLGIMKAGGVYVPVDPAYPQERIAYMLKDTSARFAVTDSSYSNLLTADDTMTLIELDQYDWSNYPSTKLDLSIKPAQLVYTIYTSGTTGIPKGVLINHGNLTNLVHWHNRVYEVSSASRTTMLAGIGFDASTWEIWPYLSSGATIFTVDAETRLSVEKLRDVCIENKISHSFMPTVLVPDFVDCTKKEMMDLEYLVTGGDALSSVDVSDLSYRLFNNYGPTENTVITTFYEIEERNATLKPSIGKPVDNVQVYILDQYGNLVPRGVVGEIYAGGKGVAQGYLNRPELTAERFVKDPFSSAENARLYKTGDLAKWLPDGNIDILGRIDNQIQIRGYRVELGEIESVMTQSGLVSQSIVLPQKQEGRSLMLVAYVIEEADYDKSVLLDTIKAKLPAYMVPAVIIELEEIPLTANGKVDKRALPAPDSISSLNDQFVAPRNAAEEQLARIWQSILKLEKVGVHHNFFELGGHSLLAMKLIAKINLEFDRAWTVSTIFTNPTIESLAQQLTNDDSDKEESIIVNIRSIEEAPNLFLVPGGEGLPMAFYDLGQSMKEQVSVYSLQSPGIYGSEKLPSTVEALATLYVEELLKVQQEGPYHIGGYSFGGSVAFEMALQLERLGKEVAQLILFDALTPDKMTMSTFSKRERLMIYINHLAALYNETIDLNLTELKELSDDVLWNVLHKKLSEKGIEFSYTQLQRYANVFIQNTSYEFPAYSAPLNIPVLHFKAATRSDNTPVNPDDLQGWEKLTNGPIEQVIIPGNHWTLLKQPNLQSIIEYDFRFDQ